MSQYIDLNELYINLRGAIENSFHGGKKPSTGLTRLSALILLDLSISISVDKRPDSSSVDAGFTPMKKLALRFFLTDDELQYARSK